MTAIDRTLARIALAAAPALLMAAPAAAQQRYTDLFVFGDSLVDAGNAQEARRLVKGADPAPAGLGYFDGRFSNGDTFADYLSMSIGGGRTTASLKGGLNFSVGGAQAREVSTDASPSFAEQVAAFSVSGKSIASTSLVLVTFGGNDVRTELEKFGTFVRTGGDPTKFVPDFSASLTAFRTGLDSLYTAGARNFIVTGLPDIGQIPVVTDLGSPAINLTGTAFSRLLNTGPVAIANPADPTKPEIVEGIKGIVDTFRAGSAGANADFFDLFAFQQGLAANPTAFGLPATLDTTRACLRVPGAAPACDGFIYFDTIHPTTQVHRAIASGLATQLGIAAIPEPASWALMLTGFVLVAATMRRRRHAMRVTYA